MRELGGTGGRDENVYKVRIEVSLREKVKGCHDSPLFAVSLLCCNCWNE